MAPLEWGTELSVGIPEFDRQHQELVDLVNRAYDLVRRHDDATALLSLIDELLAHIRQHFADEEAAMRDSSYPRYEDHCREHDELLDTVIRLQHDLRLGRAAPSLQVPAFLKSWLLDHILESDMAYARLLTTVSPRGN